MCPGDETVGAYVAGELAASVRQEIDRHLDRCATCQELVVSLGRAAVTARGRPGDAAASASHAPHARTLGRYVIDTVLGAGGMGVVYRAHDPQLGRPVALKVVRPHDDRDQTQARARLVREARAMAKISHPNVIAVHDAGMVGDEVFIAMELVAGETLVDWERAKPRPWREVVDVYLQAARGLAAAHRAGLVHRDFKPHNALIGADGRVRVLDFGLVRSLEDALPVDANEPTLPSRTTGAVPDATLSAGVRSDDPTLTRTGTVMGSPQFMSPEQHRGQRADARSDQFSYCVALYHALYGKHPYTGTTYEALALAVTEGDAAPPPRSSSVPSAVARVLARGLRRDPADRFATMDVLLIELASAARGRRRWLAAGGLALVGSLAVAGVVLATRTPTPTAPIALAFSRHQQPVTATGTLVHSPDLSPDGKQLVYATSTRIVFRTLATGATREIELSERVYAIRWSPRGDRVAVTTQTGPALVDVATGAVNRLSLSGSTCQATWVGGDAELLWACGKQAGFTVVTLATRATRKLPIQLPETDGLVSVDWSPAGLVFITRTDGNEATSTLWTARADGSGLSRHVEDEMVSCVRWNARGDRIYLYRRRVPGSELVYRDARNLARTPVTVLEEPSAPFTGDDAFALASDERSVIYAQGRHQWDVVLYTKGDPVPRNLTNDHLGKQGLSVSPDGRSIVYASGERAQTALYRQRLDGGAPEKLAAPERFYIQTTFSPDGSALAVTALVDEVFRTSIVPLTGGAMRDLEHGPANLFWRPHWTPQRDVVVMSESRANYFVVEPASGTWRSMWPSDFEETLFRSAIAPDGEHVALLVSRDTGAALAVMKLSDRSLRIVSPSSEARPFGWSSDGAWIYAFEKPEADPRRRVVAISASGDGVSRLIALGSNSEYRAVLPDESGMVEIAETHVSDLWLASLERLPTLAPPPPAAAPAPPAPPAMHPSPVNLALAGTAGTPPDGWVTAGAPQVAVVTTSCGRPGSCVELDAASASSITQYIDAAPYRGRRIRIAFDARVEQQDLWFIVESGVYARTELPAGAARVTSRSWRRHSLDADVAPDAVYLRLTAHVPAGAGRAWIAKIALSR